MAVTGIRKTSSYTLLALAAISLVVFALFFFGGYELDAQENKVYAFTDALLIWSYVLSIASIVAVLAFVIKDFFAELAQSPAQALKKVAGPLAVIVLLVVTYVLGSDAPLQLNEETERFNTSFWLKFTDMWIYSSYVLLVASVGAAIFGSIKSALNR